MERGCDRGQPGGFLAGRLAVCSHDGADALVWGQSLVMELGGATFHFRCESDPFNSADRREALSANDRAAGCRLQSSKIEAFAL
jgi:hypothetical protein